LTRKARTGRPYYRRERIPLTVPPLRGDGPISTADVSFLNKYNTFMNKKITGFTEEVEYLFENYDWPGNVRELENAIEYGTNMAFGDKIGIDAVPSRLLKNEVNTIRIEESDLPLNEQVRLYEKEILIRKLKKYGNNGNAKELAAKELGLSRATLYRKLAELGIT
jgi:transcriptional regulator with PAS, ATPase and Fis domain